MSVWTAAVYERLAGDAELIGLLAEYRGGPAIFTIDPVPGDATLPYIVTAGEVAQSPFDTKNSLGRRAYRDVRCYASNKEGSVVVIEAIAERVRALFHRYELSVDGFGVLVASCNGPVVADEDDAYGRIVTVQFLLMEV